AAPCGRLWRVKQSGSCSGSRASRFPLETQATRLPLQLSRIPAGDVAFQMRDGGALAGDDVLDQIADGNNADDFSAVHDRQMADVFGGHERETFVHAFE